jgi:hypothetical protein
MSYWFGVFNDYNMAIALRYYGDPWAWQWWAMQSGW